MLSIIKTASLFSLYTVIYLLTELALYARFAALFGSEAVSFLYSAAMFMTGCGYLLFPLTSSLLRTDNIKNKTLTFASVLYSC